MTKSATGAKAKPEPRPLTAQPIGAAFGVDTRGLEHYSKHDGEMVSDNARTMAPGCYRRLPTNNE